MGKKHTIVINGIVYDTTTGLPVGSSVAPRAPRPQTQGTTMDIARPAVKKPASTRTADNTSKTVHRSSVQHSTTLRRAHLNTPANKVTPNLRKKSPHRTVAKSPMIAHFASHPQPLPKPKREPIETTAPAAVHVQPKPATRPTSKQVKTKLIQQAEKHTTHPVSPAKRVTKPKKRTVKHLFSVRRAVAACAAIVLLSGYFTYMSLPGISVSLAGAQSGVAAHYPNYRPDGYSFEGPVSAKPGIVEIRFKSNGGGDGYTIRQQASNWNSAAVLDNYVAEASGGKYDTTSQQGLTLYTYGSNIAWSNGDVFYTINSEASLSPQQLIDIATSM